MNKAIAKLIAALMALVLSVAMIVTITYAWMTLSSTPVVEGIQITIGGGNTILVAANLTETVDGVTYNYPGRFSDTLNFGLYEEYDYLNNLAPLSPVSTADGIYWFLPERYGILDNEVILGGAVAGQLKPITGFTMEYALEHANLEKDNTEASKGSYAYFDFWVVSPGTDYTLRVSKGDDNQGSYVLELMTPEQTEAGSYTLTLSGGSAQASARVGFLVNEDYVVDNTMYYYQNSYSFDSRYSRLRGSYQIPGGDMWYSSEYRFTIFEPNADYHPLLNDNSYYMTSPLGWNGTDVYEANISNRLSVQLTNSWNTRTDNNHIAINEIFQAATIGKNIESVQDAKRIFYEDYLQRQFSPYVRRGSFIKKTTDLYNNASDNAKVSAETLNAMNKAGATDDVYIVKLQKDVPQRIRTFIWLEGQDIDCGDSIDISDLALSLELAGSN